VFAKEEGGRARYGNGGDQEKQLCEFVSSTFTHGPPTYMISSGGDPGA
jgi:hypothetical protein